MSFQSEFVNPMRASRRYQEWAADSPGDAGRFLDYAAKIAVGKRPAIPRMVTQFGRALVGAGKPWLPPAAPPPAPPPPVSSSSVFAGRGAFVSHDPEVVLRERLPFTWVAVHGDGLNFTTGEPLATPELVAKLKAAGYVVHAWYSWDHPQPYTFAQLGAKGFIGQAESAPQKDKAIAAEPWAAPRALVTNNDFASWPAGYAAIPEAYYNVNPNAKPGSVASDSINRGCPKDQVFPCFGTWESATEPAVRVPLSEYVSMWAPTGFSCYLAENLTAADIAYLKALPR